MKILTSTVLAGLLASPTLAQQTMGERLGANAGDRFGAAVAFVGDVNHDGRGDFVVGAPGDDTAGVDAGSVTLYSGTNFTVLQQWFGLTAGARLGESVDGAGDVNQDGSNDVIAGAPGASQALVFSGANGSLLYNMAPASGLEFGVSVAGVGFADGDNFPDFAVGASGGTGLWVFSGRTGGLHWSHSTASLELDGLGDVDGDGFDDLLIGDPSFGSNSGGRTVVFSGRTGSVIRTHLGQDIWSENLGQGATALGDLDGDGVNDYAYGAPCICFANHYIRVHSGASGVQIHQLNVSTIGADVAPGGDLDLDGTPDILATEPGRVFGFAGSSAAQLFSYTSAGVIDGGSDVNGDGFVDILGGASWDASNGANAGRVTLTTLGCPAPAPENYCAAVANSTGQRAGMDWQNTTSVSANNFRLTGVRCPPNKPGIFFYGPLSTEIPAGEGHLCVTGSLLRLPVVNTGPLGEPGYSMDFNNPPNAAGQVFAGDTWHFSFWYRDPQGGPSGFNFADGLRVTFCP